MSDDDLLVLVEMWFEMIEDRDKALAMLEEKFDVDSIQTKSDAPHLSCDVYCQNGELEQVDAVFRQFRVREGYLDPYLYLHGATKYFGAAAPSCKTVESGPGQAAPVHG